MRIRRSLPIVFVVLAVAAAVALVVVLRKHAPPEPARLLPGADGFVYVNLQWMRRANLTGELPAVPHDPEYEQFIQATGFQFERDLEEAAVAVHYPSTTGENTNEPRFSEVFVGKLQGEKMRSYLRSISRSIEDYHSVDIYNIALEGRTLRVAILGVDTVAASNHPDVQVIHGIVERSRKLASPFGGPALLRQYYKHVPFASLAWAIFNVQPGAGSSSWPLNLSFLFSKPAVVLASLRYLGTVHFRAAAYTGSENEAKHVTDQLGTFLSVYHAAENTVGPSGSDADLKALFDSLKVEQQKDRALLTATVPPGLIRKALAGAPVEVTPEPAQPSTSAPVSPKKRQNKRAATEPAR